MSAPVASDLGRRFVLSRHAALKTRRDGDVLVLPERAIRLGGSGGEILRLCSEGRSGHDVVAVLRDRYPDASGIESQVVDFFTEMLELGGVVAEPAAEESEASR